MPGMFYKLQLCYIKKTTDIWPMPLKKNYYWPPCGSYYKQVSHVVSAVKFFKYFIKCRQMFATQSLEHNSLYSNDKENCQYVYQWFMNETMD